MRFIPTQVHGLLDYALGVLLIASPWIFQFSANGAETWIPVGLGLAMVGLAFFTAYEWGLVPVVPMSVHLGMDLAAGLFLAVSPWLFQFDELVWTPHLVFGILEVGGSLFTQTGPIRQPRHTIGADAGPRTAASR